MQNACAKTHFDRLNLNFSTHTFSKQYDWTAIYINDAQGPFLFCTKYEWYYQTNISLEKSLFDYTNLYLYIIHTYGLICIYNRFIWSQVHSIASTAIMRERPDPLNPPKQVKFIWLQSTSTFPEVLANVKIMDIQIPWQSIWWSAWKGAILSHVENFLIYVFNTLHLKYNQWRYLVLGIITSENEWMYIKNTIWNFKLSKAMPEKGFLGLKEFSYNILIFLSKLLHLLG